MERDEDGVVLGSTRLPGSQRLHRKGDATREAGSLVGPMTTADSPSAISVFRIIFDRLNCRNLTDAAAIGPCLSVNTPPHHERHHPSLLPGPRHRPGRHLPRQTLDRISDDAARRACHDLPGFYTSIETATAAAQQERKPLAIVFGRREDPKTQNRCPQQLRRQRGQSLRYPSHLCGQPTRKNHPAHPRHLRTPPLRPPTAAHHKPANSSDYPRFSFKSFKRKSAPSVGICLTFKMTR